jgi:3-oxoacyl-[acyl-carrier protein] reductase
LVKKFSSLDGNILGSGTKTEKLDLLKKNFPNIKVKKFDISDHSRIEEFIDNVDLELGGIDILINNAGTNVDNLALRMKDDEWKKVIDLNLGSTFFLCKYGIKKMLKNKYGRIVNITSIVGHTGNLGQSNYAAAKAGIMGFTKSLAREVGVRGITVNAIAPEDDLPTPLRVMASATVIPPDIFSVAPLATVVAPSVVPRPVALEIAT